MTELSPKERIAAAKRRRADTKTKHLAALEAQEADDLEAVADLEEEHDYNGVRVIDITDAWRSGRGAATRLVFKVPERGTELYSEFLDFLNRGKTKAREKTKAGDQLGMDCLVYPDPKKQPDMVEATLELAAGVLQLAAVDISEVVSGKRAEEGK